jgi:hypothetical protein
MQFCSWLGAESSARKSAKSNGARAVKAIPTEYGGCRFRSRLEARWAAYFDLREFRWVYEPFDLDGWIPDFLLTTQSAQILVEVKPIALSVHGAWLPDHGDYDKAKAHANRYWILLLGVEPDSWGRGLLLDAPADCETHWLDVHESLGRNSDGLWLAEGEIKRLWREAGNRTQWKAPVTV